jgi:ATP-dependent DNA helicase RecQ
MRRQRQVMLSVPVVQKLSVVKENPKAEVAEALLHRLRSLRKKLADEQSVPPYVVFHDSTLKLMAQVQPKNMTEFGKLSGVGSHKLAQYGETFLTEIRAYRQEQNPTTQPVNSTSSSSSVSGSELQTLQLHQQGLNIAQIAQKRNLSPSTIASHLEKLIEKNQPVDLNQLVPLEHQQKIWQVLEVLGDIALTPIKEQLGDSYTFNEIRLVREKWRRQNRK